MIRVTSVVLVLMIWSSILGAQRAPDGESRLFISATMNRLWSVGDRRGITGTLGAGLSWRRFVAHLHAADVGSVSARDGSRYGWRATSAGLVCETLGSREVVGDEFCGGKFHFGAGAELLYRFGASLPVMVGAGYRLGDDTTPFGTVAVALSPLDDTFVFGRVSVGRDFAQIGLGVGWPRR
jgi:hypothetical protein